MAAAAAAAGDSDSWDADTFSVEDPVRKVGGGGTAGGDRWEGEDGDGPGPSPSLKVRAPAWIPSANWRREVTAAAGPAHVHTSRSRAACRDEAGKLKMEPHGKPHMESLATHLSFRAHVSSGPLSLKDNWDDDDDEKKEEAEVKPEVKISEKKKIAEKIKEKERQQKKRQEEIKKRLEEPEEPKVLTPEEQLADKLRLKKLQEESDLELAKETFGVNNTVYGIDAMNPSSRDDFTEFGKLLKDKITQYEKSLYYASFLEALVRDVCISLEIDDLKKITNSLTVLCSEKQKQEKQSKAKKKKKGVVPGGGLKATMKDDLADYGGYDGGYVQDYEDFM
nr:eukaryotic translation initiation factor 3 subunit J [Vicugna pacos]